MNDSNVKGSMTRRGVVAATLSSSALAGSAGVAYAANGSTAASGPWDLEAEAVVIGTGALGWPTAIIAREADHRFS